jgi:hypothetical protein
MSFYFLKNLVAFARGRGRWWLVPIVLILLLVSLLAAIGALAPYAAFLYPL